MCITHQLLKNSQSWNWDGDVIIYNPIIPNTRRVSNILYDVDIREFLTSKDNAVIKKTLNEIAQGLHPEYKTKFYDRQQGCFDFRANVLKEYISNEIMYVKSNREFDAWLFPDETITLKKGDCEDRAFLLASLMIASGISNYNIRLSFGKIEEIATGMQYDHVWVMYKNEGGIWELIEPLTHSKIEKEKTTSGGDREKELKPVSETPFNYIPYFIANDEHLWAVRHIENNKPLSDYISERKFWTGYNPSFGSAIHKDIIKTALNDSQAFVNCLTESMKKELTHFWNFNMIPDDYRNNFAEKVVNVDIPSMLVNYNPLLHYDNAFIKESFDLVNENLKDKKTLDGIAMALHATEDFYSHTSYPEFAKVVDGKLLLMTEIDPDSETYANQFTSLPAYGIGGSFDLNKKGFSVNTRVYKKPDKTDAINFWNKKIISGRYGQNGDSHAFLERTQYWPSNLSLSEMQGAIPHHNEMAVDDSKKDNQHVLYGDNYPAKYTLRLDGAIRHTRLLWDNWAASLK